MSRRLALLIFSFVLAAILVSALVRIGGIDLRTTLRQLQEVRLLPFSKLVLLTVALILVSTEKWRRTDVALRHSRDYPQARLTSFALTSAGLLLGTLLPTQLAMSMSRTLGISARGNPLKRGTAGTLFEQSFDLVAVGFLAVASAATWLLKGGGMMWASFATAMASLALLVVGPLMNLIRLLLPWSSKQNANSRWFRTLLRNFSEMAESDLLSIALARRLVLLSAVRFVIVAMMLKQTAAAINVEIPLWHLAAAQPFVLMASAIVFVAGNIGLNELTLAGCLALFGTPLPIAAQWSLVNRVLVTASYLLVAAVSASMVLIVKLTHASGKEPVKA
jgi:uncharacterized membrane protein YidH (DUF202 family)